VKKIVPNKLPLRRETLRDLDPTLAKGIVGGMKPITAAHSNCQDCSYSTY
jgi:hypothetical protein